MAHRRGFVRRTTPSLKTWIGQAAGPAFGTDITAAAGLASPGLKVFGTPGVVDVTILRTRGEIMARGSGSGLFGETYQLALGIGLCTTEAAAAGAVPLPFDNPDWDGWFVYQVQSLLAQIDMVGTSELHQGSQMIDSKAMRKIPSGQVLFLSTQIFSGAGSSGGTAINEIIQARQLQKTS